MTKNYDKYCTLIDVQMDGLTRAVDTQDLKKVRWHSQKIEGLLNSAEILLTSDEWTMMYNKYSI